MDTIKVVLFVFGMCALVIVPVLMLRILRCRNKRSIKETGAQLKFEAIGGGRFNGESLSYPFVRISVYEGFVVIKYSNEIVLDVNEIEDVIAVRSLVSSGIRILHTARNAPKDIIIWTSAGQNLRGEIFIQKEAS